MKLLNAGFAAEKRQGGDEASKPTKSTPNLKLLKRPRTTPAATLEQALGGVDNSLARLESSAQLEMARLAGVAVTDNEVMPLRYRIADEKKEERERQGLPDVRPPSAKLDKGPPPDNTSVR